MRSASLCATSSLTCARRFSDLVFHIVGKNPPPEIQNLHGVAGINVAANVTSVEPYYQRSALTVVPLRAGSGTRLKILESMALGRPVVSTSLGAEGYRGWKIIDTS